MRTVADQVAQVPEYPHVALEIALDQTAQIIKSTLTEANAAELGPAEDVIADLFFEIREARKAMSAGKATS